MTYFNTKRPLSHEQKEVMRKMNEKISGGSIKAVSFRMKGSLVITPLSVESDIFMFMEKDFSSICRKKKSFTELRIEAQEKAEKKCSPTECVTLEKIYSIIGKTAGITAEETRELMEKECSLVKGFSFPRECGKNLFNEAQRKNKKIIIVADPLYPKEVTESILEKCGYSSYNLLVVPHTSDNGGIFDTILEKSSLSPSSLVHIGGNVEYDIEVPVLKGIQAILLSPVVPMMIKSGRLRGFVEADSLFEVDSFSFLALRCAFGLYSVYGFDFPQNKTPKSDFCNDPFMIGFMVYGTLSLVKNFKPESEIERDVISAMEKNEKICTGRDDFIKMFAECFGEFSDMFEFVGLELPLAFLTRHSAPSDRALLGSVSQRLSKTVTEPNLAPVYAKAVKKNALSRFADKLFPPGTKVRTIADGILAKSHR